MATRILPVTTAPLRGRLALAAAEAGFDLTPGVDLADAASAYHANRPDLVLLEAAPTRDHVLAILAQEPTARIVLVAPADAEDAVWRGLLAGARDIVDYPFALATQLAEVVPRVLCDPGTPQAFMEEFVGWHELATVLVRHGAITTSQAKEARALVSPEAGEPAYPNVYASLLALGYVEEAILWSTLHTNHREVSAAFQLMKSKRVSMQQLRAAFTLARHTDARLSATLVRKGLCQWSDFKDGPWDDPPPSGGVAARRPPRPPGDGESTAS